MHFVAPHPPLMLTYTRQMAIPAPSLVVFWCNFWCVHQVISMVSPAVRPTCCYQSLCQSVSTDTAPLQTIYLLAVLDRAFSVAFAFWGQPSLGIFFHNCLISAVWEGLCKLTDLQCRAVATLRLHGYRPFCPCRGASPARTRSGSGRSVRRPFGSETWSCSGTARTGTWTPFRLEIKGEKGGKKPLQKTQIN